MKKDKSDESVAGMSQHAIIQMFSGAKGFYFGKKGLGHGYHNKLSGKEDLEK